ncbi:TAXI family TRAP transporter solute-binding subunit [Paracoccus sp. Z330]|uniref:TAXI family TRAP transporter solute-binding subunit n=1 Tax=Paracoccus onchidii TaxID=3017813 RepID=A0ABT4ZLC5_9RHOB|nr:TAXI family TRAP transporter solute-binding subunit [Paracoccus onchidii]MDB6179535.1 TAXI family TRAP transporter solute-binding subunit [Paracoccus onchidii]
MIFSRKIATAAALGLAVTSQSAIAQEFVTIGTAGQTGIYYVVGQSVCQLVNRNSDDHGFRCTAPATGGSIANLNGIREGDFNFGVVQSDWQYHAVNGGSVFEEFGPNDGLRAVFSAHPDVVTVVARADSGIQTLDDLPGKRVNIGNPGSGSRATAEVLLETKGIDPNSFSLTSELKSNEQSAALCDNKIDAMMFSAGHPVGNITEATVSCDTVFLQIDGPQIDALVEETPYYEKAQIPAGMYKGQDADIQSYGPLATFVTSTDTSDEAVYQVVKAIFENFDRFKALHPAFAHLQEEDMVSKGNIAPLHDGAVRYYRERGWM